VNKTDKYLNDAFAKLGIRPDASPADKYSQLDAITQHMQRLNSRKKVDKSVTGNISERLCELALEAALGRDCYTKMSIDWRWLADFSLLGDPFNVLISVKSMKARERLIASGARSLLTPTIGWGVFDDPSEWSENRVKSYVFSGFSAIYMPLGTLRDCLKSARSISNPNGNPLLRAGSDFADHLKTWQNSNHLIDIRKI